MIFNNLIPLVPRKHFRAETYQVCAFGRCEFCGTGLVDLRYAFNPYGDDQLMCEHCADLSDQNNVETQNFL